MRVTLVHNPAAGDEAHGAEALCALIAEAGHTLAAYRSIEAPDWADALGEPADLVAVAGGDGTARKVLKELVGKRVVLTLLPLGSANNIATSLGYGDEDTATLVRGWTSGRVRPFDVGQARGGGSARTRFVEAAGGGVFADVLARAERIDFHPDGEAKVEFGLRLLREAVADAPVLPWALEADGVDLSGEFIAVEAMNVSETGPSVPLAPGADAGDGRLDLVRIRAEDRAVLAAHVDARLAGRRPPPLELPADQVASLSLRTPREAPLRVDDELWRRDDPLVLTPGEPVEVLVPASARGAGAVRWQPPRAGAAPPARADRRS